jgi:hypothetical protein
MSRAGKLTVFAVAAVALCTLAIPTTPANAQLSLGQIYLGWDFGNGFGIGIGQVPSSYNLVRLTAGRCIRAAALQRLQ